MIIFHIFVLFFLCVLLLWASAPCSFIHAYASSVRDMKALSIIPCVFLGAAVGTRVESTESQFNRARARTPRRCTPRPTPARLYARLGAVAHVSPLIESAPPSCRLPLCSPPWARAVHPGHLPPHPTPPHPVAKSKHSNSILRSSECFR